MSGVLGGGDHEIAEAAPLDLGGPLHDRQHVQHVRRDAGLDWRRERRALGHWRPPDDSPHCTAIRRTISRSVDSIPAGSEGTSRADRSAGGSPSFRSPREAGDGGRPAVGAGRRAGAVWSASGRRPARDRSARAAVGVDRKGGLGAGVRPGKIELTPRLFRHHACSRKLADLKVKGQRERPAWMIKMAALERKTLIVCKACHDAIHAGRPTRQRQPTSG
jgi:hypothetical protein